MKTTQRPITQAEFIEAARLEQSKRADAAIAEAKALPADYANGVWTKARMVAQAEARYADRSAESLMDVEAFRNEYARLMSAGQLPMVTIRAGTPTAPAECVAAQHGGGTIIRIKSHTARQNVQRIASKLRGMLSIKWAFQGCRHAADNFYLVSDEDAAKIKQSRGRWMGSVSFPARVPFDLSPRMGGIFG